MRSFPGFGIIIMIDFFHLLTWVVAETYKKRKDSIEEFADTSTAQYRSLIIIFVVIRSPPKVVFGLSSLMTFVISFGRNEVGVDSISE